MRREPGKSARSIDTYATSRAAAVQRAPGRGSRSQQRYGEADPVSIEPGEEQVHQSARRGVAGSATDLPFIDVIQMSFGPHDVSGVRAHTDPAAQEANAELGARAYATGDDVAFGGTPDLHTAAHEAAHVVQQRGGVQLAGGVGREGDAYEAHADAVADRVVRGESAVDLLDQVASAGPVPPGTGGVQRRAIQLDTGGQDDTPARIEQLRRIHFFAMPALLRELESLKPFSWAFQELARRHFGPRLVVAMQTVQTRAPWGSGEMSALPEDQQRDIITYLGGTNALPEGDSAFSQMWNAHPHNGQQDPAHNTSDDQVRKEHGFPPVFENTCACRLSIMLNGSGHPITPASVKAAGIARPPFFSQKTKQYYIISAAEAWRYLAKHFRGPDVVYPARGEYKTKKEFETAFISEILPVVASRKGIVAFEHIFGFSGTGHMDLFDGVTLSDATGWYPCHRLRLWYVAV